MSVLSSKKSFSGKKAYSSKKSSSQKCKIQKLSAFKRVKLSPELYKKYIKQAKKCGVETLPKIFSLKAPAAFVSKPWLAEPIPTGFDRLALTKEEYRQKVFNRRARSKVPLPKESKKYKGTKTIKAFRRLSLGSADYKKVIQQSSSSIKSLRPVKKQNKQVKIPGRKPLAKEVRKNFERLSTTAQERKQEQIKKEKIQKKNKSLCKKAGKKSQDPDFQNQLEEVISKKSYDARKNQKSIPCESSEKMSLRLKPFSKKAIDQKNKFFKKNEKKSFKKCTWKPNKKVQSIKYVD